MLLLFVHSTLLYSTWLVNQPLGNYHSPVYPQAQD